MRPNLRFGTPLIRKRISDFLTEQIEYHIERLTGKREPNIHPNMIILR
jgi:hypothetical protein